MEANPPQPKVVKVIKAVDALYFDGHCQQPIGDKSIGQIGEADAWHYDEAGNLTCIDVRFDYGDEAPWSVIEAPIENFVAIDQECPECYGEGWFDGAGLTCEHCHGWGLVEKG